jgi:predicted secreted acid phosphatase
MIDNIIKTIEPENLDSLKDRLKNYHDSGDYYNDIRIIIDQAKNFLYPYLNNKNNCVIFDIDETCITEYDYMLQNDFAWTNKIIVMGQTITSFPAIPHVLDLFNYCQQNSISTIILTSRRESYQEDTLSLLNNSGFINYDFIYLRTDKDTGTIQQYKYLTRKHILSLGYNIILNIGDQFSDFDKTGDGVTALCNVKISNPYYFISDNV